MNVEAIAPLIENGTVKATRHPSSPLTIYNYTAACQYERRWCDTSKACRGLILHDDGRIIARPFPKFFNAEEHPRSDIVFSKPFTVAAKLDGSLGVLYHDGNDYAIATRGSFTSEQAVRATQMLRTQYRDFQPRDGYTYLFEIIYPGNRIVVNYGDRSDLVLLAVIDTETGRDADERFDDWQGGQAARYNVECHPSEVIGALGFADDGNTEGVVLRFDWPKSGPQSRVKVKLEEYKRLHRLLTGTSEKTIWEHLSQGGRIEDLADHVPDEFHEWMKSVAVRLLTEHADIRGAAWVDHHRILSSLPEGWTRKDYALQAVHLNNRAILFKFLDNEEPTEIIWKQIKPEASKPFRGQSEDVA